MMLEWKKRKSRKSKSWKFKSKDTTPAPRDPSAAQFLEDDLVTLLLDSQRHNYSRLLARDQKAGSWQLRTAKEYIAANAHLTLSLGDICQAAGVSSRTLQRGFRQKRGCTPMQFLKNPAPAASPSRSLASNETTTGTDAASRWGFLHDGRFAADYQSRFREKPSETIRRSRQPKSNSWPSQLLRRRLRSLFRLLQCRHSLLRVIHPLRRFLPPVPLSNSMPIRHKSSSDLNNPPILREPSIKCGTVWRGHSCPRDPKSQ